MTTLAHAPAGCPGPQSSHLSDCPALLHPRAASALARTATTLALAVATAALVAGPQAKVSRVGPLKTGR